MVGKKGAAKGEKMRLYLVDASSYAYRAYHATERQGMTTSAGLPTGATLVFTNMLLKLIREEKPTHLAVVWDARGKTFRHERFPEYKAQRAKMPEDLGVQLAYMRKISGAFRFANLELQGYEADDLIGTIARKAEAADIETVIVSGDKDLTQLVSESTTMLDTLKDTRMDVAGVTERFEVGPDKVIEVLALWGDSSDNIPGVPKVGEKTAKKLIREYGSVENVLKHAGEVKGVVGENLKTYADQARLSRELVTIVTDVPVQIDWADFDIQEPDREKLTEVFKELQFTRLLHEFGEEKPAISYEGYRAVTDAAELKAFVKEAERAGLVSVDTETTSIDPVRADLVGVSLAVKPHESIYVPVAHAGLGSHVQMKKEEALEILAPLLTDPKVKKIGQNMKYDFSVLTRAGIEMKGLYFDTMVASYLINSKRRTHNLTELASEYLDHKMITYEDVTGKGKAQLPFAEVSIEDAARYSGEDADVALLLMQKLGPLLEDMGLTKLFSEIEMPLIPVLARMEMTGVFVDVPRLEGFSKKFEAEIGELQAKIHKLAGQEFNIDSPKQLGDVLFVKLQLPSAKKTKTGFSTNQEVLDKLAEDHELPRLVLEYRSLSKLKGTYTDALAKLVNPETGRIHTSYNQTVTSTGRLSSSDPNLQNIPVRTGEGKMIREAFVGEGKNLILSVDYSQIELRIMAHIAEEPALLDAFRKGEDIHARTASEVFEVPLDRVTPDQRRHAKVINFGILYGMSAHGLTRQLHVEHKQAQAFIDAYFKRYPRVKLYMENTVAEGRARGYVSTIMGRRLPLPEIYSSNFIVRQASEREAINAPLQGSAADIIKIAMVRVDEAMREKKFASKLIMQVHDELVLEAVPGELDDLCRLVVKEMEGAAHLKVRLKADASSGKSWAEAH
ncbi:MAG TPA: DNA polymerase I [bacterium]|nr:DNA polymerase I [bacterium]